MNYPTKAKVSKFIFDKKEGKGKGWNGEVKDAVTLMEEAEINPWDEIEEMTDSSYTDEI